MRFPRVRRDLWARRRGQSSQTSPGRQQLDLALRLQGQVLICLFCAPRRRQPCTWARHSKKVYTRKKNEVAKSTPAIWLVSVQTLKGVAGWGSSRSGAARCAEVALPPGQQSPATWSPRTKTRHKAHFEKQCGKGYVTRESVRTVLLEVGLLCAVILT